MTDERVESLLLRVREGWAPPPRLTVSEFADRELVVTSGPLSGTHWSTDFAPYQRGFLDVFHLEPGVEFLVIKGSAQFGKTASALALVAYHIAHDPCQILLVEPTEEMAKDLSVNRLEPLIAASPVLRAKLPKGTKTSANTILSKRFPGGELNMVGTGSGAPLASRSVRLLILDETGKYKPELKGEGNTIDVAIKRTISYRGRRRVAIMSTPTTEGDVVSTRFAAGDQRRFHVPCPECGCMHTYQWKNVRWESGPDGRHHDPSTARLHCPACDHGIDDAQRVALLSRGEWRAEAPQNAGKGIASFHVWEAYSPFSSLAEIVSNFRAARDAQKQGDQSKMHAWINTTLGEEIRNASGEGVEPETLLSRVEVYPAQVPRGACYLTCGADVQDDRLEALVVGWGPGEESWLIDRHRLPGDPQHAAPWLALDDVLARTYQREGGGQMRIAVTCLDTAGHRTTQAYDYVAKHARLGRHRIHAIVGRGNPPDKPRPIVSKPSPQTWGASRRPVDLYTIGVDVAKLLVTQRIAVEHPGPGYVHIPTDPDGDDMGRYSWVDLELAEQLTAERLVPKFQRGVTVNVWKKIRQRNEMLDCSVYALAALRLSRVDLTLLAARMAGPQTQEPVKRQVVERRVGRSGYLA